ncbi:MAG: hypothetical protein J6Q82_03940 [Clostridia bacterium]|nr:hypothetical protein [Clostridia bacterium]
MDIKELCSFYEKTHQNVKKADESYIRVMSSNVLNDGYVSGEFDWTHEDRSNMLSACCLTFLPDFIGFQEMGVAQIKRYREKLADVYAEPNAFLGRYQNIPTADGQRIAHCFIPIFYNKHKYDLITSHYRLFFVKGLWGIYWALYQSKENPEQKIIHANMHPSADGARIPPCLMEARRELIHLRRHYPNVPIVFTGDYNARYETETFQKMFEGLDMTSGMLVADESDGVQYWNHQLGNPEPARPHLTTLDHVSVTTDLCDVKLHRVLRDEMLAKASDHYPIFVDVKLK